MRELLLLRTEKNNVLKIINYIGNDEIKYQLLVDYIVDNKVKTSDTAAWALSHCHDNGLGFFDKYLGVLFPNFNQ